MFPLKIEVLKPCIMTFIISVAIFSVDKLYHKMLNDILYADELGFILYVSQKTQIAL